MALMVENGWGENGNGDDASEVKRLNGSRPGEVRVRELLVLELRLAGASYTQIQSEVGFKGPSGVHYALKRAMERNTIEGTDQLRALECGRLDKMQAAIWPQVLRGDAEAVRTVIRIMQRRALMMGLDAPIKIDIEARIREDAIAEGLDPDECVTTAMRIIREHPL